MRWLWLALLLIMTAAQKKKVYLIRHAESEENRKIASLKNVFRTLSSLSMPSSGEIYDSCSLINIPAQVDSALSPKGELQVKKMGDFLRKSNFLVEHDIQLVVHSPLQRAKDTCLGLLGCLAPGTRALESIERVVELDLIAEKYPSEWLPGNGASLPARMLAFQQWLREQPECRIAVVGHSQYFKAMLELDYKFDNCEVWCADFDAETEPVWENVRRVHECAALDTESNKS